jgi:hypothetical protein
MASCIAKVSLIFLIVLGFGVSAFFFGMLDAVGREARLRFGGGAETPASAGAAIAIVGPTVNMG